MNKIIVDERFTFLDEDAPRVTIVSKEYLERLERLDENVKKKISELNYLKLSQVDQSEYEYVVKLLESLYK